MSKINRMHKRNIAKASRRSAGPLSSDTKGIVLNGRCIIDATPGSSQFQLNMSPMSGTLNLGAHHARLAAEADLWQEFRFTKLKIYYLPMETPSNRNQCSVVGFTNVLLNYAPASIADVLALPSSHIFVLGGAGTTYPTYPVGARQSWSIPSKALNPPLTKWLVCSNAAGSLNNQGNIWGYFNYTASTGPNVWMYVEFEVEFRNPVPAGVTLVLNKDLPTYRERLLQAIQDFDSEEKTSDQQSSYKEEDSEWSDAASQKASLVPVLGCKRVPGPQQGAKASK